MSGTLCGVNPMQRYKLTIAYDGSSFHGWQAQNRPDAEPLRTVQLVVAQAAARAVGHPVKVVGASRTDAGVHAIGQVAHVDLATRIPVERLASAINYRLPDDVEIRQAEEAPFTFDAIFDAQEKQYRYRIWMSSMRPLDLRSRVHTCYESLDLSAMREAAALLVGTHDFASFASVNHGRQTTVRTIFACDIEEVPPTRLGTAPEVHIVVRGNGFLYNMVRIIAGTLVEIGRRYGSGSPGEWTVSRVADLLAEPNRDRAGRTLSASGLCLEWIRYATLTPDVEPAPAPSTPQGEIS